MGVTWVSHLNNVQQNWKNTKDLFILFFDHEDTVIMTSLLQATQERVLIQSYLLAERCSKKEMAAVVGMTSP